MNSSWIRSLCVWLFLAAFSLQGWSAEPAVAKPASPRLQALAASLNTAQVSRLLILVNRGDALALAELPGIGPARAAAIESARPFASPLDLLRVPGIGEATLTGILNHARTGFPKKHPKDKRP